ncbi:hypothetical protein ACFVHB_34470 [Kitasatospora sp. NPDC127111]|uniref:hypothetical protein n=1 Tax=Kitasatospora sp. NPDC127111 TaxID=3345363 RepID=UPI00363CB1BE
MIMLVKHLIRAVADDDWALFGAVLEWSWSLAEPRVDRVRLFVHEANPRAHALEVKAGFRATGLSVPVPGDGTRREVELAVTRNRTRDRPQD